MKYINHPYKLIKRIYVRACKCMLFNLEKLLDRLKLFSFLEVRRLCIWLPPAQPRWLIVRLLSPPLIVVPIMLPYVYPSHSSGLTWLWRVSPRAGSSLNWLSMTPQEPAISQVSTCGWVVGSDLGTCCTSDQCPNNSTSRWPLRLNLAYGYFKFPVYS